MENEHRYIPPDSTEWYIGAGRGKMVMCYDYAT